MSLMIEMLKKIKTKKSSKPVPPGIEPKNSINKRIITLSFITVILILSGIGVFLYLENIPQQNILVNKAESLSITNNLENTGKIAEKNDKKTETNKPIQEIKENSLPPLDLVLNEIQKDIETDVKEKPIYEDKKMKKEEKIIKTVDPTQITAFISLAENYMNKGDLLKAYQYYRKAYSINNSEDLLNNILILAVDIGKIDDLKKYISKTKNEEIISSVAIRLVDNGRFYLAQKILKKYQKRNKGYIDYAYGYYFESTGDISKSLFYYEKAYSKIPSDPYIAYAYARILEIKGMLDKAYKIYKKILNLSCDDEMLIKVVNERIGLLGNPGVR